MQQADERNGERRQMNADAIAAAPDGADRKRHDEHPTKPYDRGQRDAEAGDEFERRALGKAPHAKEEIFRCSVLRKTPADGAKTSVEPGRNGNHLQARAIGGDTAFVRKTLRRETRVNLAAQKLREEKRLAGCARNQQRQAAPFGSVTTDKYRECGNKCQQGHHHAGSRP